MGRGDGATCYGAGQYGYNSGWGMAALAAHGKWVPLVFMRATDLADDEGVLDGTGRALRHVKLRSLAQFEERVAALRSLLTRASTLNG